MNFTPPTVNLHAFSPLKSNHPNHCRLGQGGGGYHRECLLQVQADARQQGSARLILCQQKYVNIVLLRKY